MAKLVPGKGPIVPMVAILAPLTCSHIHSALTCTAQISHDRSVVSLSEASQHKHTGSVGCQGMVTAGDSGPQPSWL